MEQKTVVCIFDNRDHREPEERLALAAKKAFGIEASPVTWELLRGKKGKPFFLYHPELFLSISHSGPYWICALSGERIGVDIQQQAVKRGESRQAAEARLLRMAQRHFEPEESNYVENGRFGSPYQRFFEIWAAKESYVKYTGQGIDGGFGRFSTAPEEGGIIRSRLPWTASGVWFWEETVGENYILCVCTRREKEICVEWMTDGLSAGE